MNHDRLFKELLTSFFYEFLELFFQSLSASIDRNQLPTFLDKESFGELPGDLRREKDLVARVRLMCGDACFIIHLEHEAQNNNDFPARMFTYFSRLLERYGPPIYPIAVFSRRSRKPRPTGYLLHHHDMQMLDFRYLTLELAELDWTKFINQPNPVASALMARMKIQRADRPRVKLQCLRLLATLRLEPEKSALIWHFVESYLSLDTREVRIFKEAVELLPGEERQAFMRYKNSFIEEGIEKGRLEGIELLRRGLKLVLTTRFGPKADSLVDRLSQLEFDALDKLQTQLEAGADLDELT